jgi:hypothetical protein
VNRNFSTSSRNSKPIQQFNSDEVAFNSSTANEVSPHQFNSERSKPQQHPRCPQQFNSDEVAFNSSTANEVSPHQFNSERSEPQQRATRALINSTVQQFFSEHSEHYQLYVSVEENISSSLSNN